MISISPSSYQRKAWDLNPHDPFESHGLANRPGKPYPATFRNVLVESRGIEPRFPPCHSGVFPLDHDPVSGAPGNRTPITWVQAKCLPVRPASQIQEVRPGIEPGLPPYHSGVRPKHLQTSCKKVIPAGIEPALSWMSARRLNRWTTGS